MNDLTLKLEILKNLSICWGHSLVPGVFSTKEFLAIAIKVNCLLEVALALWQLNPIHKKGPESFFFKVFLYQSFLVLSNFVLFTFCQISCPSLLQTSIFCHISRCTVYFACWLRSNIDIWKLSALFQLCY